jgi:hypothetical protein
MTHGKRTAHAAQRLRAGADAPAAITGADLTLARAIAKLPAQRLHFLS